ncbi:MAG TPA: amidohydrolase, partial [Desulfobacteraceae bacterium]|nr:amidohydrolase [Desulfobacteraceae bacterium]
GDFEGNLSRTLTRSEEAASMGADIVVFPEMNLTGYVPGEKCRQIAVPLASQWTDRLSKAADRLNIIILAGLVEKAGNPSESGQMFATHLAFFPEASPGRYRKLHLSPFEAPYFTPGSRVPVFERLGLRFGVQLCYDAHFPDLSTAMALKNADVVFIPHASPRGTAEDKYNSWMRHLTARAFDNGMYVAAVNQTGKNGGGLEFPGLALCIGPDGNLASKKTDGCEAIHMVEIDRNALDRVRSHKMRYFLPNRRPDLID